MMPGTGTRVGRFHLVRVLGSGGFGTVWEAVDSGGVPVAVKLLDRMGADAVVVREQLLAEAAALRSVDSPHTLRVIEVIDDAGVLALVTDLVPGVSLRQVLDEHGTLSGQDALVVLRDAALGLAAVHAAGLVHGDVKPANVLVEASGSSKLIDFGLVSLPGWVGEDSLSPWGSPAYAPPEQVAHDYRDHRSDIYSLTVTLFEVLCGQRPFTGDTVDELRSNHVHQPLPDPRLFVPDLGDGLTQLLMWGLAKNPDERPQDVATWLQYLEAAAAEKYGPGWAVQAGVGAVAGGMLAGGLIASGVLAPATGSTETAASAAGSSGAGAPMTPSEGQPVGHRGSPAPEGSSSEPGSPLGTGGKASASDRPSSRVGIKAKVAIAIVGVAMIAGVCYLVSRGGGNDGAGGPGSGPAPAKADVSRPVAVVEGAGLLLENGQFRQAANLERGNMVLGVSPDGERLLVKLSSGDFSIVQVRDPDQSTPLPLDESITPVGFVDADTIVAIEPGASVEDDDAVVQIDVNSPDASPVSVPIDSTTVGSKEWEDEYYEDDCGDFSVSYIVGSRLYGSFDTCMADDHGHVRQAAWVDIATGTAHHTQFSDGYGPGSGQAGMTNAADEYLVGRPSCACDGLVVLDVATTALLDRGSAVVVLTSPPALGEYLSEQAYWADGKKVYAVNPHTGEGWVATLPEFGDPIIDEQKASDVANAGSNFTAIDPNWQALTLTADLWPHVTTTGQQLILKEVVDSAGGARRNELWSGWPTHLAKLLSDDTRGVLLLPEISDFAGLRGDGANGRQNDD